AATAKRLGRQQCVIVGAIGERRKQRASFVVRVSRRERTGPPVTPDGLLPVAFRQRVDGGLHVVPRGNAQRGAYAPCLLFRRERYAGYILEPLIGRGIELTRRVPGDAQIAV